MRSIYIGGVGRGAYRIESFAEAHAGGVAAEGWISWTAERAGRALAAPGVVGLVALESERVVGVAQVLIEDDAAGFYESFPHRLEPGVRIYA